MAVPGNLRDVQVLLYRLITSPEGVAERLRIEFPASDRELTAIVRGDEQLSAADRLGIYAGGYFHRLLDCLKEDFPATLAVLGAEKFQQLVADYLAKFPPTEPSIFYAGQHFAEFIGAHRFGQEWLFAEDLARLERTTIEVFHGPDAVPLDAHGVELVPLEQWPDLKLRTHRAVTILSADWKVNEVLRAVNEAREWSAPAREATKVIVFRQGAQVYFRELERAERSALGLASGPVRFADLCEAVANESDADDPASEINRLFQRWLADGILVAARE